MGNQLRLMFEPIGPFTVPLVSGRNGRHIETNCPAFREANPDMGKRRGCYVFAKSAGGGFCPIYVGRATKSFKQECFSYHKIAQHYAPALSDMGKGRTVMFFFGGPERCKGLARWAH